MYRPDDTSQRSDRRSPVMPMSRFALVSAPEAFPYAAHDAAPTAVTDAARLSRPFSAATLTELRHLVHVHAQRAGLADHALDDFVMAVHELATNAVRHGGGSGRLELRRATDTLVCEVIDRGPGFPAGVPAGSTPPPAERPGGRGLWLARLFTDTLIITDGPSGVTACVTACLPQATSPAVATQAVPGRADVATTPGHAPNSSHAASPEDTTTDDDRSTMSADAGPDRDKSR
jgi:serine/threonine-protein kinase RsbW